MSGIQATVTCDVILDPCHFIANTFTRANEEYAQIPKIYALPECAASLDGPLALCRWEDGTTLTYRPSMLFSGELNAAIFSRGTEIFVQELNQFAATPMQPPYVRAYAKQAVEFNPWPRKGHVCFEMNGDKGCVCEPYEVANWRDDFAESETALR